MSQLFAELTAYQRQLEEGNRYYARGKFAEAKRCYDSAYVLNRNGRTAYSVGLVNAALGRREDARHYYLQSLALDPAGLEARVNLGNVLRDGGENAEALHHHLIALGLAPTNPLVVFNLALTLDAKGQPAIAEYLLQGVVKSQSSFQLAREALDKIARSRAVMPPAKPDHDFDSAFGADALPTTPEQWTDYGSELLAQGKLEAALHAEQIALDQAPLFPPARHNQGAILQALGRDREAMDAYRSAISLYPNLQQAWINLAGAYRALHLVREAWDVYFVLTKRGLDLEIILPEFAETSRQLGRFQTAVDCMDQLAPLLPGNYMVPNNRGSYLLDLGRYDEALACFQAAAALNPGSADVQGNIGAIYELRGDYEKARDYYGRAAEASPGAQRLTRYLHVAQHLCHWRDFEERCGQLIAEAEAAPLDVQPFSLLAIPGITAHHQRASSATYAMKFQHGPSVAMRPIHREGRIRIGYASSDLYDHATSWLIAEIFELHDRASFEIFAYSYGNSPETPMRKRLRDGVEHFHDIKQLNDDEAAHRIRADGVDILLDLKGYTRGGRPGIFARRPAPIQINYLGFPGTSGAGFIDYIVADNVVVPPELEQHYSEKILRLPHCYQPNDRKRALPAAATRAEAGLPPSGFVFCSFNAVYKITPDVFELWCRLLRETPDSVLWILSSDAKANANLQREARARGIDPARLVFAPRVPLDQHLARFRCADLFLDTFPCTAHTTASDALWCGVPVVTRTGETFASRVAASILQAAQLPQLITADAESYYALASRLAARPGELTGLKQHLDDVRYTCPLFDSRAYTRDLEAALIVAFQGMQSVP